MWYCWFCEVQDCSYAMTLELIHYYDWPKNGHVCIDPHMIKHSTLTGIMKYFTFSIQNSYCEIKSYDTHSSLREALVSVCFIKHCYTLHSGKHVRSSFAMFCFKWIKWLIVLSRLWKFSSSYKPESTSENPCEISGSINSRNVNNGALSMSSFPANNSRRRATRCNR